MNIYSVYSSSLSSSGSLSSSSSSSSLSLSSELTLKEQIDICRLGVHNMKYFAGFAHDLLDKKRGDQRMFDLSIEKFVDNAKINTSSNDSIKGTIIKELNESKHAFCSNNFYNSALKYLVDIYVENNKKFIDLIKSKTLNKVFVNPCDQLILTEIDEIFQAEISTHSVNSVKGKIKTSMEKIREYIVDQKKSSSSIIFPAREKIILDEDFLISLFDNLLLLFDAEYFNNIKETDQTREAITFFKEFIITCGKTTCEVSVSVPSKGSSGGKKSSKMTKKTTCYYDKRVKFDMDTTKSFPSEEEYLNSICTGSWVDKGNECFEHVDSFYKIARDGLMAAGATRLTFPRFREMFNTGGALKKISALTHFFTADPPYKDYYKQLEQLFKDCRTCKLYRESNLETLEVFIKYRTNKSDFVDKLACIHPRLVIDSSIPYPNCPQMLAVQVLFQSTMGNTYPASDGSSVETVWQLQNSEMAMMPKSFDFELMPGTMIKLIKNDSDSSSSIGGSSSSIGGSSSSRGGGDGDPLNPHNYVSLVDKDLIKERIASELTLDPSSPDKFIFSCAEPTVNKVTFLITNIILSYLEGIFQLKNNPLKALDVLCEEIATRCRERLFDELLIREKKDHVFMKIEIKNALRLALTKSLDSGIYKADMKIISKLICSIAALKDAGDESILRLYIEGKWYQVIISPDGEFIWRLVTNPDGAIPHAGKKGDYLSIDCPRFPNKLSNSTDQSKEFSHSQNYRKYYKYKYKYLKVKGVNLDILEIYKNKLLNIDNNIKNISKHDLLIYTNKYHKYKQKYVNLINVIMLKE